MNQFEQELRKLFVHDALFEDTKFIGRMCYGKIGDNIRVRAELTTLGHADHYEALKITMLNRTEGVIDTVNIRFSDLYGKKQVCNPNFREGVNPHLWYDNGRLEWYVYKPTPADFEQLSEAVDSYLEMFREPTQEMSCGMTQEMG